MGTLKVNVMLEEDETMVLFALPLLMAFWGLFDKGEEMVLADRGL
jgi:hypothetical protein